MGNQACKTTCTEYNSRKNPANFYLWLTLNDWIIFVLAFNLVGLCMHEECNVAVFCNMKCNLLWHCSGYLAVGCDYHKTMPGVTK